MKYTRYRYQGKVCHGMLQEQTVRELSGGLLENPTETGPTVGVGEIEWLCPCEPTKILAVGLNYGSHIKSHAPGRAVPQRPEIFYKPPSSLLPHGGEIRIPKDSQDLHYEGELVIVIGSTVRRADLQEAESAILGFTCGIDVSERVWQKNDLQWWRAKGCDTFAPAGPVVVTDFDWRNGSIETRLNGAAVQSGQFSELLFPPPAIVSYVSQYLTLEPGDLIYTGTPGSTGKISDGDTVEVEIPGIGILRNTVTGT